MPIMDPISAMVIDARAPQAAVISITPSRSKPDRAIVVVESITSNQRDEALQKLTSKVVVFRKP
ncbi:hypothetical protein [Achromobacter mucicolens]|uniref:hypothetical protein n=1 Tax=Achromobacter mucicolens TaxID=1389922 RepID=UPI001CBAD8A7|nr:hypothetical protein [Achromobacter mucicolens]MDH1520790.1 hypothetical protein [Achromobacter mucicolens]